MWRPSVNAELPGDDDALSIAKDFLHREGLLPGLEAPFSYGKPVIGWANEVAQDHFFLRSTVREMVTILADVASHAESGAFTAAAFRDRVANGRKQCRHRADQQHFRSRHARDDRSRR